MKFFVLVMMMMMMAGVAFGQLINSGGGGLSTHTGLVGVAVHGLGSASTNDTGDFATTAQGALADSALQASDLNTFSELDTLVTNKTLVNEEDAATFDSMIDLAVDAVAGTDAVNYQTMVAYEWVTAPASNTAAGTAGQKAYDDNYLYICVSNATWRRTVIASW